MRHDGDGSRLGDWARGHVEDEVGHEVVAHGRQRGGTAHRRWQQQAERGHTIARRE
jgi:hypothetical protein